MLGISQNAFGINVIVNSSVTVHTISRSELWRVYAMRTTVWPDKQPIVVYVLSTKSPTNQQFCKEVMKIFPYQLERIWNKLTFSGMGVAPIVVSSEQKMLEAVAKTPGAIGYVQGSGAMKNVNTIKVEG